MESGEGVGGKRDVYVRTNSLRVNLPLDMKGKSSSATLSVSHLSPLLSAQYFARKWTCLSPTMTAEVTQRGMEKRVRGGGGRREESDEDIDGKGDIDGERDEKRG